PEVAPVGILLRHPLNQFPALLAERWTSNSRSPADRPPTSDAPAPDASPAPSPAAPARPTRPIAAAAPGARSGPGDLGVASAPAPDNRPLPAHQFALPAEHRLRLHQ